MSETVGALCSWEVVTIAVLSAVVSVFVLVVALHGGDKVPAWASAVVFALSSLVLALCFWRVLGAA